MAFEQQNGEIIAIGFRNGEIKILNTETLQDISSFTPSSDSILFLKFSSSGSYFAGYDAGNHTLLFKRYGLYCTVLYCTVQFLDIKYSKTPHEITFNLHHFLY